MIHGVANEPLSACVLGPMPYRQGLALQEEMARARSEGEIGDWLLFPDHPPVLTVGRGGGHDSIKVGRDVLERLGIEVFEVSRGGDITWHGPGQLVGYLVCDLARVRRDLHRFLRGIEQALIRTLAHFGIEGQRITGRTGIWVNEEKIASIGIAVRRWVSYHGFALNVAPDLRFFDLIHPCGLRGVRMTSVSTLLGSAAPSFAAIRVATAEEVAREFGYGRIEWAAVADVFGRMKGAEREDHLIHG